MKNNNKNNYKDMLSNENKRAVYLLCEEFIEESKTALETASTFEEIKVLQGRILELRRLVKFLQKET